MSKMKRVLEAFGEPILYGGQESFVFKTIKNMNKSRIDIDFLTPYFMNNPMYQKFAQSIKAKIYIFNLPFKVGGNRFNVISKYNRLLKKNKYDIVHIHSGSISILAIFTLLAKINGVNRIIVHSHTSGENENFKHELLKRFFSPVFSKMATVLLAPSYDAAYWQFPKKAFKKKGKLIKNGIEVDKYLFNCEKRKKIRKQLEFSTNDTILGNVGRLSSEKNQIFLIRLLKSLVVINKKYKLLLVGDGPQYKILKTIVEKQNLSSNVKFVGNVNNVEDYLQAMDIFLFPSKYEGLGIASIEAQASGLPIIASTGVPEDINITGNVKFLSLGSPINEWIKVVRATDVNNRLNNMAKDRIVDKGYDIRTTAAELRRIYLENDK